MNKPLLIIICDFLLLSLLSMANFERPEEEQVPAEQVQPVEEGAAKEDLVEALQTALEQEQQSREQLEAELDSAFNRVQRQEQLLAERENRLQQIQHNLSETEELAQQLGQERQSLEQQVTESVRSLVQLEQQLNSTTVESQISKARLEAMQEELRRREEEQRQLQNQLQSVKQQQEQAEQEKQQLAVKLGETEAEKRVYVEQLDEVRKEVAIVREEKKEIQEQAKVLAEGVGQLAEQSGELTKEIRENRPLSSTFVFSELVTNRVSASFVSRRSGFGSNEPEITQTFLVSDGTNTYALFHTEDTPVQFRGRTDYEYIYLTLMRGYAQLSVDDAFFLNRDPRIMLAPVSREKIGDLNVEVYSFAKDPFKFGEAILVDPTEGYYGEAPFSIDPEAQNYIKMERKRFSKMFGEFVPSRGDMVFNKSGELLGIMVNDEYCVLLDQLEPTGALKMGARISVEDNARLMERLNNRVENMPSKLK